MDNKQMEEIEADISYYEWHNELEEQNKELEAYKNEQQDN